MFLGFLMATLSLKLRMTGTPPAVDWIVPVLVLGVAIFDMAMVSISRMRRGLLPFATLARITRLIAWRIAAWAPAWRSLRCTH